MISKKYIVFLTSLFICLSTYGCSSNEPAIEKAPPSPVKPIDSHPIVNNNDSVNLLSFGAKGDGKSDDTKAIQSAIDSCADKSATLVIPKGVYYTRPLFLKSKITIFFEEGATLLGSDKVQDYKEAFPNTTDQDTPALIYGKNVTQVRLKGKGVINGRGESAEFQFGNNLGVGIRHKNILFIHSNDIIIEDLKILNAAFWNVHLLNCENATLKGLNIYSHANWNNDGIDIDGRNITVSDCVIDVDDDALCLKSTDFRNPCKDIEIKNCTVASNCNAIKLGTASYGGFKNVKITSCEVKAPTENNFRKSAAWEGATGNLLAISGIALESVDGGEIDGVEISDINMKGIRVPIFIRLGDRSHKYSGVISRLKNVLISNITAVAEGKTASSITGIPNNFVESVTLKDISITLLGGGKATDVKPVPECITDYPEAIMFGQALPASGFYVRHAKDITFENVGFNFKTTDERELYIFDDVTNHIIK